MYNLIFRLEKVFYTILFFFILFFASSQIQQSKLLVIFMFLVNGRLIFHYRKVIPILLFFLFSFSYILPFYDHFFSGISVTLHESFNTSYYLGHVVVIFGLFLLSVFIFTESSINYVFLSHRLNFINSSKAFYALLVIVLLLATFALRGESMLSGNSYGGLDVEKSPLFEYSLVFFALAVCFYDQSKIKMSLILLLISFILIKDLLYGGRITSIMLLLLTYSMYFEDKIAKKYVFILFGVSIFVLISFQFIRTHPFLFLSGNISLWDIFNSVVEPNTNGTLASNQGDIAQSSARLYGFVDQGILPFEDRVSAFYYFVVSIFTPGISFSELGNLAQYKKDEYSAGGGGLLPVFFYVWLSYPGVVLSGYLVSTFNKLYVNAKKNYMIIFAGLLLATFPRWFVYSPIIIFKLCAYVIPFYLIFINIFFKKVKK